MAFDYTTLITDRSAEDCSRWKTLRDKGWANMTAAERQDWEVGLKGAYNAADLNRVGDAVVHIANRLRAAGNNIEVSPKTDWTREDIPSPAQMVHYLEQIQKVRDVLAVYQTTPAVPADMEDLTHGEANDIEKILVDIDQLITNMIAAYYYSGELYGGDV